MEKLMVKDKFPVYTLEIPKQETRFKNADEVVAYLKSRIEAHPVARLIAVFDHYGHVKAQEQGEIDPSIVDSKNLLFCMSGAIPNALIGALRPRSIAVNELQDRFVVNFLEPPMEKPTETMTEWVHGIANPGD